MSSPNDPRQGQTGKQQPPPSFTPGAGRPSRPDRTPAIEVGSPSTGSQPTRRINPDEPPTSTDSQKIVKIKRQSDLPPTVTPRPTTGTPQPVRRTSYTTASEASVPQSIAPKAGRSMPEPTVSSTPPSRRISSSYRANSHDPRPGAPRASAREPFASDTHLPANGGTVGAQEALPTYKAAQGFSAQPGTSAHQNSVPQRPSAAPQSFAAQGQRQAPHQIQPRVGGRPDASAQQPGVGSKASARGVAAQSGSTHNVAGVRPGGLASSQPQTFPGQSTLPDNAEYGTKSTKSSTKRTLRITALALVALLIAWPIGLVIWANGKLNTVEALSGAPGTDGTTYLIAGSDSRSADSGSDIKGARADTIMLLHVPKSGPTALISLPRDIYVPIPGHNPNKINASFSIGGAPLLVKTVEELTNLTVDHYVELGFDGVKDVVDAVGGVELCLDYDVKDKESGLKWKAGCAVADGKQALAFARMRKADPLGDIGRAERQRQVVSAVAKELKNPTELMKPGTQIKLVDAGTGALVVSEGSGFFDLGKMALAFLKANSDEGVTGTPPIVSLNYRPGGVGSAVQLDEELTAKFFEDIAEGNLKPGEYNSLKK